MPLNKNDNWLIEFASSNVIGYKSERDAKTNFQGILVHYNSPHIALDDEPLVVRRVLAKDIKHMRTEP